MVSNRRNTKLKGVLIMMEVKETNETNEKNHEQEVREDRQVETFGEALLRQINMMKRGEL
jgi:hypothetical protein